MQSVRRPPSLAISSYKNQLIQKGQTSKTSKPNMKSFLKQQSKHISPKKNYLHPLNPALNNLQPTSPKVESQRSHLTIVQSKEEDESQLGSVSKFSFISKISNRSNKKMEDSITSHQLNSIRSSQYSSRQEDLKTSNEPFFYETLKKETNPENSFQNVKIFKNKKNRERDQGCKNDNGAKPILRKNDLKNPSDKQDNPGINSIFNFLTIKPSKNSPSATINNIDDPELQIQSRIKPSVSQIPSDTRKQSTNPSQLNINELIMAILKNPKKQRCQSPLKTKRKKKKEMETANSKSKFSSVFLNPDQQFSSNCVNPSSQTIQNSSFDHGSMELGINEIMTKMIGNSRHLQFVKKLEEQKNLKLKDYLRLASLSLNNKKDKNKGNISCRSLNKQKQVRNTLTSKYHQNSPHKVAIDKSQSLNLLKNAIQSRFSHTISTAKTLLSMVKPPKVKSDLEEELLSSIRGQTNQNSQRTGKEQTEILGDSYEDLVFMCKIHRIFQDCLFMNVNVLQELLQNFEKGQKAKKMGEHIRNHLDNGLKGQGKEVEKASILEKRRKTSFEKTLP